MIAAFFSTHTLDHLLSQYGYAAVFAFVMVESLGVPFPGETMLITAALYAGTTHNLSPWLIWAFAAAGAMIGDNIGFAVGWWGGYRFLIRYGSKIRLDEAKLKVGRLLFAEHGGKVVFFGRFVSILRTYAAFLAGVNRMHCALLWLQRRRRDRLVWHLRGRVLLRRQRAEGGPRPSRLRPRGGRRGGDRRFHRMAAAQREAARGASRARLPRAARGPRRGPA